MKKENLSGILLPGLVALLWLVGCGTAQPSATPVPTSQPPVPIATRVAPDEAEVGITITFEGDHCVYHGPERFPAGHIPITLDVSDQSAFESYFVGALTLDEGKTVEDLRAWTNLTNYPLWVHEQGSVSAARGTAKQKTIILFEGPLYLGCLTRNPKPAGAGWLDPVEVVPLDSD